MGSHDLDLDDDISFSVLLIPSIISWIKYGCKQMLNLINNKKCIINYYTHSLFHS